MKTFLPTSPHAFVLSTIFVVYVAAGVTAANAESALHTLTAEYLMAPNDEKSIATNNMIKALISDPSSTGVISADAKQTIEQEFNKYATRQNIILASLVNISSVEEKVRMLGSGPMRMPQSGRFDDTTQWAAKLMMARRGDQYSINDLLSFANEQDFHNKSIFVSTDFKYVPKLEIVEFLSEQLFSDERLESTKSSVLGVPAANYAASSLAVILKGFPVDYEEDFGYTEDDIVICRDWMIEQSEWKFK